MGANHCEARRRDRRRRAAAMVEQMSGWTGPTDGLAVPSPRPAPASGVAIRAGFEFDVPVRFDSDTLSHVTLDFERLGSITSIPLVDIRDKKEPSVPTPAPPPQPPSHKREPPLMLSTKSIGRAVFSPISAPPPAPQSSSRMITADLGKFFYRDCSVYGGGGRCQAGDPSHNPSRSSWILPSRGCPRPLL